MCVISINSTFQELFTEHLPLPYFLNIKMSLISGPLQAWANSTITYHDLLNASKLLLIPQTESLYVNLLVVNFYSSSERVMMQLLV